MTWLGAVDQLVAARPQPVGMRGAWLARSGYSARPDRTPALARRLGLLMWFFSLSALVGCGGPQPIQDRFYRLDPAPRVVQAGTPAPAILLVNNLVARGFLGGRQILYRTSDEPLLSQRYDTLLWDEPPAGALSRALVNALRASNIFRFVVIPTEQSRADYILSGELQRLEHLPTAQPPRVAATVHLTLVPEDGRNAIASRTYSGEEVIDGSTPDAMVEAFKRLGASLIASAIQDLQDRRVQLQGRTPP